MISTRLFTVLLIPALVRCLFAAPPTLNASLRQEIEFAVPIEVGTELMTEPEPTPPMATPDAPTLPTEPPVVDAPLPSSSMTEQMDPEASGEPMMGFYYNIGGSATGMFEGDPVDYVVGDTEYFEIPSAEIQGDDEYAEIYKSHRYGKLGSTWGYDIPVSTPGMYDCTLHYAETYSEFFTDEPNRTFEVTIYGDGDGQQQTAEFDVMVELGGQEFTAYKVEFPGIYIATTLHLRETPSIGDAFLSGISCIYTGSM